MLSLRAVMPPHEIDHDADGDDDHGAGRPAENAEPANIGDHKRCDPERRGRRRRCRQGKARSVGHISHSSSPSSSIPVSGNEKDNRGQQYHQETKTPADFERWAGHWISGVPGRDEYVKQLGEERVRGLGVKKHAYAAVTDYGY